jgi:hypothetical protein
VRRAPNPGRNSAAVIVHMKWSLSLAMAPGLSFSFDFDVRAPPSKFQDGGSTRAQLDERPAGCLGKLLYKTTIDEPTAHGFHFLLVCRSRLNERQWHRRSIAFRAVASRRGASWQCMESIKQSRKDVPERRLPGPPVRINARLLLGGRRHDWQEVAHDITASWIG